MVAHNLAVELKINGKTYKDLTAHERPNGYLVASALAVINFDLLAWKPAMGKADSWVKDYITEPEVITLNKYITYTEQPACSVCIRPAAHWNNLLGKLKKGDLDYLASYGTKEMNNAAVTAIHAAKINWYQTNHHTGQGTTAPLIAKVISTNPLLCAMLEGDTSPASWIHRASHWASTHVVLNTLAFWTGRVLLRSPYGQKPASETVGVSSDFAIRVKALPAGTGPNHIIHATLAKHGGNGIWALCGQAPALLLAAQGVQALIERTATAFEERRPDKRLRYHVGSVFLTGEGQLSLMASPPIAAVGSFLFNLAPGSTLTKSPLISKKEGSSLTKVYLNKEGYDDAWEAVCAGSRAHKTVFNDNVKRALGVVSTKAMITDGEFAKIAALAGVTDEVSRSTYRAMNDILREEDAEASEDDEEEGGSGRKRKRV